MKIWIVGPGAVGGYLAAKLSTASNHSVNLLARERAAQAIGEQGLTVRGAESLHCRPRVTHDMNLLREAEIVFFSVKIHHLDELIRSVTPHLHPNAILVTLQNGIDADGIVRQYIPKANLAIGISYIDAHLIRPGEILAQTPGRFTFGPSGSTPVLTISDLLRSAGIRSNVMEDFEVVRWTKLCWNVVFNPMCVLAELPVDEVRDHGHLRELGRKILDEVRQVAAALDIDLSSNIFNEIFSPQSSQGSSAGESRTSMWDDLVRGQPTEIDFLNGAIVRRGNERNIPTPVNSAIVALVHGRENARAKSTNFSTSP